MLTSTNRTVNLITMLWLIVINDLLTSVVVEHEFVEVKDWIDMVIGSGDLKVSKAPLQLVDQVEHRSADRLTRDRIVTFQQLECIQLC